MGMGEGSGYHADWVVARERFFLAPEWQHGLTIAMTIAAILVMVYAIQLSRKLRSPYPVFVCLGSAVAAFYEPLGDLMTHIAYFEANGHFYTRAFGNEVPTFVLPGYVMFFGFPILYLLSVIGKGTSQRHWFTLFIGMVVFSWGFEQVYIRLGVHSYYEPQPFTLLKYPVWMAFANAATMLGTAAGVYLALKWDIVIKWPVLFVIIVPFLVGSVNMSASLPIGSALNGAAGARTLDLAAVASILLSILYTWIAGVLVCRPSTRNASAPAAANVPAE